MAVYVAQSQKDQMLFDLTVHGILIKWMSFNIHTLQTTFMLIHGMTNVLSAPCAPLLRLSMPKAFVTF
jgi:hypothetical protein